MKSLRLAEEYLEKIEKQHQERIQVGNVDNYYILINELRAAISLIIDHIKAEGRCKAHQFKGCTKPECN